MADLNIQLALDDLCTAVEDVEPRVEAVFPFERHKNRDATLEDYDDVDGFRKFEWVDASVGAANTSAIPVADATSAWYEFQLELRIYYPLSYWVDDDTTYRGITGIRLSDIIDLNKVLMYGDPFSARSFSYYHLNMLRTRMQGKILIMPYIVRIAESLA